MKQLTNFSIELKESNKTRVYSFQMNNRKLNFKDKKTLLPKTASGTYKTRKKFSWKSIMIFFDIISWNILTCFCASFLCHKKFDVLLWTLLKSEKFRYWSSFWQNLISYHSFEIIKPFYWICEKPVIVTPLIQVCFITLSKQNYKIYLVQNTEIYTHIELKINSLLRT